jgi:cytochrome c oxidase subunit 2
MYNENLKIYAAKHLQIGFQKPATSVMEGVVYFHDDLFVFLTFVGVFVLHLLWMCITFFKGPRVVNKFVHASTLEVVWTIIPALILIVIAIPSFSLLYSIDEVIEPLLTFKAIGHQWYWSYEFIDTEAIFSKDLNANFASLATEGFDSYLLPEGALTGRRLLMVDRHVVIPTTVPTRVLVTSSDVLHSWAVPSLGIKLDACPGRTNQTCVTIEYAGAYYGQCSEICGYQHGFMPIGIFAIETLPKNFTNRELTSSIDFILSGVQAVASEPERN